MTAETELHALARERIARAESKLWHHTDEHWEKYLPEADVALEAMAELLTDERVREFAEWHWVNGSDAMLDAATEALGGQR